MLVVELVCGIDRREDVVGAVVATCLALLIVACVGYQIHIVVLEAHTGMYAKRAKRQRG